MVLRIDPLVERIKVADQKASSPNARYQVGSAEDLSFLGDASVDVVYLSSVFHWVQDKEKALRPEVRAAYVQALPVRVADRLPTIPGPFS